MDTETIIALCAIFTALGFMFNMLLKPVKENQARLESEQQSIKDMLITDREERNNLFIHLESRTEKLYSTTELLQNILKELKTKENKQS